MVVLCRNRRLFRRIFRSHRCIQSTVLLNFRQEWDSYALCRLIRYSCIYKAHMSPALNRSSATRCFKHSDAIEIYTRFRFLHGTVTHSHVIQMPRSHAHYWHEVKCMNQDNLSFSWAVKKFKKVVDPYAPVTMM